MTSTKAPPTQIDIPESVNPIQLCPYCRGDYDWLPHGTGNCLGEWCEWPDDRRFYVLICPCPCNEGKSPMQIIKGFYRDNPETLDFVAGELMPVFGETFREIVNSEEGRYDINRDL